MKVVESFVMREFGEVSRIFRLLLSIVIGINREHGLGI